ncbi:MAG TPA: hypothetical protein VK158_03605 [Acidobacteriota bacterium]|nr:hypothetical protein [Acidobacteriota bacterium]
MDSQQLLFFGGGLALGITAAEFVRPLWLISRKSGVPMSQLDLNHSMTLDTMLKGYSIFLPFYERAHLLTYLKQERVPTSDVERILYQSEPFPNSWATMFARSRVRKQRCDAIYQLPTIQEFISR